MVTELEWLSSGPPPLTVIRNGLEGSSRLRSTSMVVLDAVVDDTPDAPPYEQIPGPRLVLVEGHANTSHHAASRGLIVP
jgi:hypothetical protein